MSQVLLYHRYMSQIIYHLFFLLFLIGCEPKLAVSEGVTAETSTESNEDASDETTSDSDEIDEIGEADDTSDAPDDTSDGDNDEFIGAWSTCSGQLTRDAERFSWDGNLLPCTINGGTTYADGILTLHPDDFNDCEVLPWWFAIFQSENPTFAPVRHGTRLTLLPTVPTEPARVLNLEETLVVEKWELVNEEEQTSGVKLCWTSTGQFFEGRYGGDDCSFLSCGGVITQLIIDDEGEEHWSTQCAGNCPCGGVITVEERTEGSLSGRYNASNCQRLMDGEFTATPQTE